MKGPWWAITKSNAHDNQERPHQAMGNGLIERAVGSRATWPKRVVPGERLGGMLRSYRCSIA